MAASPSFSARGFTYWKAFTNGKGCKRIRPFRNVACQATSRSSDLARRDICAIPAITIGTALAQRAALAEASARSAFFDISIDGKVEGQVVLELYEDATTGAQRFYDLAVGKEGVSYKRSKFDAIFPSRYIRCAGVTSLSYGGGDSPIAGGDSTAELERELAVSQRKHDTSGVVSLIIKLPEGMQSSKTKLVASQGKLVEITETTGGVVPNGTGFMITLGPAPQLDTTNLVVGRVTSGYELLERISTLPVVKDNSNSPFLAAGKAIGDKRATVAELGFNRPFNKISVAKSGAL